MRRSIAAAVMMVSLCSLAFADTTTPGSYEPAVRDNVIFWIAVLGATTGVIGAALGIYNTVTGALARRIRVKITPKLSWPTEHGILSSTGIHPISVPLDETEISFEIINLSGSAVTVDTVGFLMAGTHHRVAFRANIRDGKPWPRRLESREAVDVYTAICPTDPQLAAVSKAFAGLASGETFVGTGPVMRFIGATGRQGA
jgi:hypothetical protein